MPDFSATLRLDLIEAASAGNGCIDKFKVWIEIDIPEAINLSSYTVLVPVAMSPSMPLFFSRSGYIASMPAYPLNAIGMLGPVIGAAPNYPQSSNEGFTKISQYETDEVEYWFHRESVDMSSTEFATEYGLGSLGLPIYHLSQPVGTVFKFQSVYRSGTGVSGGTFPTYSVAETASYTLLARSCSGGGSGGGEPETPPTGIIRNCLNKGTLSRRCLNALGSITRVEIN